MATLVDIEQLKRNIREIESSSVYKETSLAEEESKAFKKILKLASIREQASKKLHTSSTTSAMPKPSCAPSWRRAKAAAASSALLNSSISTRRRKKLGSSPTSNSETMSSSERWRFCTESHRGRRISEKAPIVSLSKKGTAQTSPLPPRDAGASLLLHLNANISPTKRAISHFLTLRVI